MTITNQNGLLESGFKKPGLSYLGKIKRFYFEIDNHPSEESRLLIKIPMASFDGKDLIKSFLDENYEKGFIEEYSFGADTLEINYKEDSNHPVNVFANDLADVLEPTGFKCKCNYCEATDFLNYYTNNSVASICCPECATKLMKSFEEDKNAPKKYGKGFLFSLVGAILGSVLWIFLGAIGFVASIAGFAISFCAFKGYDMAKAKLTKTGIILNIVAIVIAFVFAQYAGLYIDCIKEIDWFSGNIGDFVLVLTPILLSDSEIWGAYLPNIAMGVLFAALGTYRTILDKFKIAKKIENFTIQKVEL